jgi:hypothetical protein
MFCEFIQQSNASYKCNKCGIEISTNDDQPPIFPCRITNLSSKEPDLATKVKNFSGSFFNHAKNNFKLASDSTIEKRFKICESCDSFRGGSCLECGCPIVRTRNYISKLSWDSEKCPLNKW